MAALGRDDERLDPSNRVLTVFARISERGCQTSITTKNVYNISSEYKLTVCTLASLISYVTCQGEVAFAPSIILG